MEDDWADDDIANYRGTEYIGKLGVEQSYEAELHGQTGFEEVEMSAGGHAVRRLKSNPATPGNAIVLSIDIKLQAMVEQLFGTGAALWSRSIPATARSWPSSASPTSTRTCSSRASTSRTGAPSTNRPTSRSSTGRCAAPIRRARPTSLSWRWRR